MKTRSSLMVATVSVLAILCGTAAADTITMELSGIIDQVFETGAASPSVGDIWSVQYTIDTTAADQLPGDSATGVYYTGATISYTLGSYQGQWTPAGLAQVKVENNHPTYGWDRYYLQYGSTISGVDRITVALVDNSDSVFSSDAQPLAPVLIDSFDMDSMSIDLNGIGYFMGHTTTWVPEPGTLSLLALAGLTLLRRRP